MLRNSTRNVRYRQLLSELSQIGTQESRSQRERERKILLQKVVNLGDKARDAKEILDIFLDGAEDEVLASLKNASTPERLMEIRAYYKACLALQEEFDGLIAKASLKEKTIEDIKKQKGEK